MKGHPAVSSELFPLSYAEYGLVAGRAVLQHTALSS